MSEPVKPSPKVKPPEPSKAEQAREAFNRLVIKQYEPYSKPPLGGLNADGTSQMATICSCCGSRVISAAGEVFSVVLGGHAKWRKFGVAGVEEELKHFYGDFAQERVDAARGMYPGGWKEFIKNSGMNYDGVIFANMPMADAKLMLYDNSMREKVEGVEFNDADLKRTVSLLWVPRSDTAGKKILADREKQRAALAAVKAAL